jgi:tetratricopeptide (TPR) repeat protein
MQNKDFKSAEKAFQRAVNQGRNSVFKHPEVYTRLVDAQLSNDAHKDKKTSLAVIQQMEREFGRDAEAQLYSTMAQVSIQESLGNEDLARQQMQEASQQFERLGGQGDSKLTLAMAKTAAKVGDKQQAEALFHKAVRNNHEDDEFLHDVEAAFAESGIAEDPRALIDSIKKEIVDLNNRGVKLAGSGKLDLAIELFDEAAEAMPGNRTINLNAAKVLVLHMERSSVSPDLAGKARRYLERVRKLAPNDTAALRVQEKFQKLVAGN